MSNLLISVIEISTLNKLKKEGIKLSHKQNVGARMHRTQFSTWLHFHLYGEEFEKHGKILNL
jgi:hypothetical protein